MRRIFFLILIFVLLLISAGCASSDFCSTSKLRKIRAALDLVKEAPDDKDFEAPCDCHEIKLVELSLEQIESCLGPPERTIHEWYNDFYYVFYNIPKPKEGYFTLGGGLELHLQFDQDNICISAEWWVTE